MSKYPYEIPALPLNNHEPLFVEIHSFRVEQEQQSKLFSAAENLKWSSNQHVFDPVCVFSVKCHRQKKHKGGGKETVFSLSKENA